MATDCIEPGYGIALSFLVEIHVLRKQNLARSAGRRNVLLSNLKAVVGTYTAHNNNDKFAVVYLFFRKFSLLLSYTKENMNIFEKWKQSMQACTTVRFVSIFRICGNWSVRLFNQITKFYTEPFFLGWFELSCTLGQFSGLQAVLEMRNAYR